MFAEHWSLYGRHPPNALRPRDQACLMHIGLAPCKTYEHLDSNLFSARPTRCAHRYETGNYPVRANPHNPRRIIGRSISPACSDISRLSRNTVCWLFRGWISAKRGRFHSCRIAAEIAIHVTLRIANPAYRRVFSAILNMSGIAAFQLCQSWPPGVVIASNFAPRPRN